jgi:hypothetical protein
MAVLGGAWLWEDWRQGGGWDLQSQATRSCALPSNSQIVRFRIVTFLQITAGRHASAAQEKKAPPKQGRGAQGN